MPPADRHLGAPAPQKGLHVADVRASALQKALEDAAAKRQAELERYREMGRRRESVLTDLVRRQRVRVDYTEVQDVGGLPRERFENDLRRIMNESGAFSHRSGSADPDASE